MKTLIVGIFIFFLPGVLLALDRTENICPNETIKYCQNVGSDAYNNEYNPPYLQGKKIGRIVGVSKTAKGDFQKKAAGKVTIDDAPEVGEEYEHSYIVDDGRGGIQLRFCEEIEAR